MLEPLTTSTKSRWILRKLMPLWLALGLWVVLVSLFSLQAVVFNAETWTSAAQRTFSFWSLWIFFLPAVVWLSLRYPFERFQWLAQTGIHVLACLAVIALAQAASYSFMAIPPPPDRRGPDSPRGIQPGMRAGPDLMIYLFTMSVCVAFAHYRQAQERERRAIELEARLAQAKLQALRMQINPHFLFNTLNAISTLVHKSPGLADDMITDLSELFRVSLETSNEHEIPLARERDLLGHYLSIQQRRFGDHLRVEQTFAPEALNAMVPTLILQPLVENAIRHGIGSQPATGRIAIRAVRIGDQLQLSVSDNGEKPVDVSRLESRSGQGGIGLSNAQARLQQLYGESQSLAVGRGELGGWKVTITLPYHPAGTLTPGAET